MSSLEGACIPAIRRLFGGLEGHYFQAAIEEALKSAARVRFKGHLKRHHDH
jgi:hypothetical protein